MRGKWEGAHFLDGEILNGVGGGERLTERGVACSRVVCSVAAYAEFGFRRGGSADP